MLAIRRKVGETFYIGNLIAITVTDIRGRDVRLSIDAPLSVPVAREECIYQTPAVEAFDAAIMRLEAGND